MLAERDGLTTSILGRLHRRHSSRAARFRHAVPALLAASGRIDDDLRAGTHLFARCSMRQLAVLWAVALSGLLAVRCFGQQVKTPAESSSPAYAPLPTTNGEAAAVAVPAIRVAPIPDALREEFKIHPFYKKHVVIRGIPGNRRRGGDRLRLSRMRMDTRSHAARAQHGADGAGRREGPRGHHRRPANTRWTSPRTRIRA